MTWKNISLKKFLQIQDILQIQDEYTALNLIDVIYDVDSATLPIYELKKYSIDFLKDELKEVKLQKIYVLNGRDYDSNFDLTVVTASQFIDYQNYIKEDEPKLENLLSVFFIPVGHTYNDGYDMKQVKEDLLSLDICTVQSAAFFFEKQLKAFAIGFQLSLIRTVKKMKIEKEQKNELLTRLGKMDLANLVSFRSYLNTAK